MRTPWRIVADLVSRKPKADESSVSSKAVPEVEALEQQSNRKHPRPATGTKPVERSTPLATDADDDSATSRVDVPPEPASVSEDVSAEPAGGSSASSKDGEQLATGPASAPAEPEEPVEAETERPPIEATATPRQVRRSTAEPGVERLAATRQAADEDTAAPERAKSIIEEMAELDAEIDVLRRALAKKLAEQNAQLSRMLGRFDAR